MMREPETPSQTAGPYVHVGLAPRMAGHGAHPREIGHDIAGDAPGTRIRIEGHVVDGTGAPLRDALVEAWQADAEGRHPHPADPRHAEVAPSFRGWGRAAADFETGYWAFDTIKPGPVADRQGRLQAPHVTLWIVARGINLGLHTRLYFDDEEAANARDPLLSLIEPAHRRRTLIAARDGAAYRLDIRLQGDGETVFLDV